jgi:hypothetical protein
MSMLSIPSGKKRYLVAQHTPFLVLIVEVLFSGSFLFLVSTQELC